MIKFNENFMEFSFIFPMNINATASAPYFRKTNGKEINER